jgi:hypothetical protein
MKKYCLLIIVILVFKVSNAQEKNVSGSNIKFGVYYFGAWTSLNNPLLTKALVDSFPERKPTWGWISTSPEVMKTQINLAANAGLSFFSFDWYNPGLKKAGVQLNDDLQLYLASPNKSRLKFNLFVANHSGYEIGPGDWPYVVTAWIKLFKDKDYLKVNNKPYLIFFVLPDLIRNFGSVEAVHYALDSLRSVAKDNGLGGVTIAICVSPEPISVAQAKSCGFDVFTAYNYPTVGFKGKQTNSVDTLSAANQNIWDRFKNFGLPYIPPVTLNWDPRPWRTGKQDARYYTGYSSGSVYRSVMAVKNWINDNPNTVTYKVAMLYAWNEYGEGGWLTPSQPMGDSLLRGLKKAIGHK